jgi:L,D-peptidoglycan transpeptidase YkuD (ErfK/YbiS/YcfS/YnhG family)
MVQQWPVWCNGLIVSKSSQRTGSKKAKAKMTESKKTPEKRRIKEAKHRQKKIHKAMDKTKNNCFKVTKNLVTKKVTKQGIEKEEKETDPVTPHVTERLIKLLKLQLSLKAR